MRYQKFAVFLLLLCLVALDGIGIQKLMQISKEKGVLTTYEDPYKEIEKEAVYFPVAESKSDDTKTWHYYDSFMAERTYGGERGHEGCDIMASYNHRGVYPVVSVCDGIIEKIGWLPMGGYRIGIRSESGVYYYYAHLSDYMKDYEPGEEIQAGEVIGFMGDTGYSEVEGTTGNFDVHLHFGIYLNDKDGDEYAIDPYKVLQKLEDHKRSAAF